MAAIQTSNYLPDIQHLLDVQGDDNAAALEVTCACCELNKLDISRSARYQKRGIERTVAFPCGHVLGDRCLAGMLTSNSPCATCPSCGYKMIYVPCGHLIPSALIPVDGHKPVRDRFPLTMPEGGSDASACKECRWKSVLANLHFTLAPDCPLCRAKKENEMECSEEEHEAHRMQHLESGVKNSLADIMQLVWPTFVTRETDASVKRAEADADRRQASLSVLVAMVLSELEETTWYRTPTRNLSAEHSGRHYATVSSIEQNILALLMEPRDDSRRTW